MAQKWRQGWMFGAGALAGSALAVWAYMAWFANPAAISPSSAALPPDLVRQIEQAQAARPPVEQVISGADATAGSASCNFAPLVPAGAERDGQFQLDAALAIHRSHDHSPFLVVADEAAREGRVRDTEVALIAACRIAGRTGASSAPLADVQSRLAQHYAALARRQGEVEAPGELMARAESLLGKSIQSYAAALGRNASKTRLAERRLAALREPAPAPEDRIAGGEDSGSVAAAADAGEESARMGFARPSLIERPPAPTEDVADLERDMQRLYSQAQAVTKDPAGMQRRHQQALAARNACRDNECVRNWYAQRKRQLFEEF